MNVNVACPSRRGRIILCRAHYGEPVTLETPSGPTDSIRLFAEGQAGSREALDRLLVRHLPQLRAFVRLRVGDAMRRRESVSDFVQSVCRVVLGSHDRFEFRSEPEFRAWLYGAVLNTLKARREYYGAEKRDPRRDAGDAALDQDLVSAYSSFFDPMARAIRNEEIAHLERAFEALSADHREVLTLYRIAGLGHEEISKHMGRAPAATRQLLHRAMARLAALMSEPGDAP